jgi:hypothetical protein
MIKRFGFSIAMDGGAPAQDISSKAPANMKIIFFIVFSQRLAQRGWQRIYNTEFYSLPG